MIRVFALTLLLASNAAGPASAADGRARAPACSQPDVLRIVAERLSRAGQPVVLEEDGVGELSDGTNRVRCAVRVHTTVYDTSQPGGRFDRVYVYQYALELRRNGVFVLQ